MSDTINLVCEGCGDDTFGVYGNSVEADYDNCANGKPIAFRVSHGAYSLIVVGQYAPESVPGGTWLIGISPDEDDNEKPLPDWRMWFRNGERAYSPALVIEAPVGVTIERVYPTPDGDE